MHDDTAYSALSEEHEDDARWAYGTGFHDPLHGIDTTVPEGVDGAELGAYCLALGDDALISAQRLAEWCARAPDLEEEMALANIGLDLLGQARMLYTRAGQADGSGRDEDDLAYFRDPAEFRNVRLAELPNGDFAFTIVRLLALSAWRLAVFTRLTASPDPVLAAVAAKGVKELAYHRQYAAEWAVRLGDGTEESRRRMVRAMEEVAPYLEELYAAETCTTIGEEVEAVLRQVAGEAGLAWPRVRPLPGSGRDGGHTEHLAPLLAELQGTARAFPGAAW
ncbi:ring-1,2-phenylacetyl-CoA epoxidase subunit PaaC [Thermocatellispora tengchongensis]|uniref:Ring-1,2-phenylacetyl-CoA epoxidase subunit PaaC n=1 Tax=Thermocatellispora tengchongensis TaxID=1073253 RepID=A0A840P777_9ACTN|nr:1,2-phenylacetyl-CoA epoxidase subunit PaaC [Thermocatellispora tengchongensis]MBB5134436.1 ring-1,2-phenylacetyl-CoA epoxidase subunit PaaC [Thermocatellispora tengchongensis]